MPGNENKTNAGRRGEVRGVWGGDKSGTILVHAECVSILKFELILFFLYMCSGQYNCPAAARAPVPFSKCGIAALPLEAGCGVGGGGGTPGSEDITNPLILWYFALIPLEILAVLLP